MTSIPDVTLPHDHTADPPGDPDVANLQANLQELADTVNALLGALETTIRSDDVLQDRIVRGFNLHPELVAEINGEDPLTYAFGGMVDAMIADGDGAADSVYYFTGASTGDLTTLSAYGRTLIALADADALRAITSPPRVPAAGVFEWYIDPAGDDANGAGTSGDPWQTIQGAIDNLLAAYDEITPDFTTTRIHLAAGTYTLTKDLDLSGDRHRKLGTIELYGDGSFASVGSYIIDLDAYRITSVDGGSLSITGCTVNCKRIGDFTGIGVTFSTTACNLNASPDNPSPVIRVGGGARCSIVALLSSFKLTITPAAGSGTSRFGITVENGSHAVIGANIDCDDPGGFVWLSGYVVGIDDLSVAELDGDIDASNVGGGSPITLLQVTSGSYVLITGSCTLTGDAAQNFLGITADDGSVVQGEKGDDVDFVDLDVGIRAQYNSRVYVDDVTFTSVTTNGSPAPVTSDATAPTFGNGGSYVYAIP